jgi:hypothetical protein
MSDKKDSPIDLLKQITKDYKLEIDVRNNVFVVIPDMPLSLIDVNSDTFKQHIFGQYYNLQINAKDNNKTYSNLTTRHYCEFIDYLKGKASYVNGNNKAKQWLRLAKKDNNYYYNMGDGINALKINTKEITTINEGVFFSYLPHTQSIQVNPDLDNSSLKDIGRIFDFINIEDRSSKILLLTYIISLFNPIINKYILYFHGMKGASKTTSFRIIRSLVDPSPIDVHESRDANLVSIPYNQNATKEVKILTDYHYCLYFDNVNYLSRSVQSEFARMALGQVDAERKLHTNQELIIYQNKPAIGINGVNQIMTQDELIQRSLIIEIDPIKTRKTDEQIWSDFHKQKPAIFASLLKVFQKTLTILETEDIDSSRLPRMADAARFMTAAAIALGVTKEDFYDILTENTHNQDQQAVDFSPTGKAIIEFIKSEQSWQGTVGDLHRDIKKFLSAFYTKTDIVVGKKPEHFPDTTQKFGMEMKKIYENVNNLGITLEKVHPRKRDGQHYKLTNQ